METEIEQARESIKEYRKGYGQSQLSTDCIIQLMILHAKKQLATNEDIRGAVTRSADGYSVDGDDMHWTVACPECEKEFEYEGYFDSGDDTKCKCGCTFSTRKVWIDDANYIE